MIYIFFDLDRTLVHSPSDSNSLTDCQLKNSTLMFEYTSDTVLKGFKFLHVDFHKKIFSKMFDHGFVPYVLTAGSYDEASIRAMLKVFYFQHKMETEDLMGNEDNAPLEFLVDFFATSDICNWQTMNDLYRHRILESWLNKGQYMSYIKQQLESQRLLNSEDPFEVAPISEGNFWLVDDSPVQRASAEAYGFRTFDPTTEAYPVLLEQAVDYVISRSSLSGLIKANLPFFK